MLVNVVGPPSVVVLWSLDSTKPAQMVLPPEEITRSQVLPTSKRKVPGRASHSDSLQNFGVWVTMGEENAVPHACSNSGATSLRFLGTCNSVVKGAFMNR